MEEKANHGEAIQSTLLGFLEARLVRAMRFHIPLKVDINGIELPVRFISYRINDNGARLVLIP